jgi:hypothetical protein
MSPEPRSAEKAQESAHRTFHAPAAISKLAFSCDDPFFSSRKARMRTIDTSTTTAKQAAFLQACQEYDPEIVNACFAYCSWDI